MSARDLSISHAGSTAIPGAQACDRVRRASPPDASMAAPRYSITSLVTSLEQYQAMQASFSALGFTPADCEYLYIDNTGPDQTGAYAGLNALLNAARGQIVILCHQDVRLIEDGRTALDNRLDALSARDPDWAVAGNAGGVSPGVLALRISDPHGRNVHVGELPERVTSLDENFIVVKREARIGFSHDLEGFHFYGADLCLHAAQMGYSAYVIDFHLEHLSPGRKSDDFIACERAFHDKWAKALSPRWLQTTCALVRISGAPGGSLLNRYAAKPFSKIVRRLPGARGWSRPHTKTA